VRGVGGAGGGEGLQSAALVRSLHSLTQCCKYCCQSRQQYYVCGLYMQRMRELVLAEVSLRAHPFFTLLLGIAAAMWAGTCVFQARGSKMLKVPFTPCAHGAGATRHRRGSRSRGLPCAAWACASTRRGCRWALESHCTGWAAEEPANWPGAAPGCTGGC
jgi:hypothetical protein